MDNKENIVNVSPKDLFPTETLSSIRDEGIQGYLKLFQDNKEVNPVKIFFFEGEYYILDGHHRVLAAIINKRDSIKAEIIKEEQLPRWYRGNLMKKLLKEVGMSTIYDFEGIAGFNYKNYPKYYFVDN